jgi:hypothetical protein
MKRKKHKNKMGEEETTNPRTLLQIMEIKEKKRNESVPESAENNSWVIETLDGAFTEFGGQPLLLC